MDAHVNLLPKQERVRDLTSLQRHLKRVQRDLRGRGIGVQSNSFRVGELSDRGGSLGAPDAAIVRRTCGSSAPVRSGWFFVLSKVKRAARRRGDILLAIVGPTTYVYDGAVEHPLSSRELQLEGHRWFGPYPTRDAASEARRAHIGERGEQRRQSRMPS